MLCPSCSFTVRLLPGRGFLCKENLVAQKLTILRLRKSNGPPAHAFAFELIIEKWS